MGLFKLGKSRFSALALTMGVCLAPSGGSMAQPADPFPPVQTLPSVQPAPSAQPASPGQVPPMDPALPPELGPPPEPAAAPAPKAPPPNQDWRTLRRVDLPAQLVRATWSETSYLSQGHPVRFGRMSVTMQMSGIINKTIVKTSRNAADGLLIENLSCYNTVNGDRKCTLLLNPPDQCYLLVYAESRDAQTERSATSRDESFNVLCPSTLALGR
jgi:hypothetical protein